MHKTEEQAEEYIQALLPRVSAVDGVDVAICVPFTDLRAMVDSARGSRVEVYAQNMHQEAEGAYTGEISAPMLRELDVRGVVLGHSERRALFGETDRALALKVPAALEAGLAPILCVGETEEERDNDDTDRKLRQQVRDDLAQRAGRAPGGGGDRVRADLGDRHGQGGHARAGAGGDRVHPRARRRPRHAGGAERCGSCTAARSSRRTRPSCWRWRTSTARSWAARRSTRRRSPQIVAAAAAARAAR